MFFWGFLVRTELHSNIAKMSSVLKLRWTSPAYNKEASVFLQRTEHNVLDQDKVLAKEQVKRVKFPFPPSAAQGGSKLSTDYKAIPQYLYYYSCS